MDNMDKCKNNIAELSKMLDKIKYKIEGLGKDALTFEKSYTYKDMEREKVGNEQLNEPLEEKKKGLERLKSEKDALQELCNQL